MKNYLEIYSLENKSGPVCRVDGARLIQDDHDPHGVTKRRGSSEIQENAMDRWEAMVKRLEGNTLKNG
jgi:hypothetical protein